MKAELLVKRWFDKWRLGEYRDLPVADSFIHTSPFGTVTGRKTYIDLVESNKDKFLGYQFEIHDEIYDGDRACVRYTARQGDFSLDVSEWYYIKNDLIEEIIAYYHIGEIKDGRKLSDP